MEEEIQLQNKSSLLTRSALPYTECTSLKHHVSSLVLFCIAEPFWPDKVCAKITCSYFAGAASITWLCFWYVLMSCCDVKGNYTGFYIGKNKKDAHLHSTSKFFLLFKSQNPAVRQQTDRSNIPSVLTLWKIISLAAGRNQQSPDHFIAFEII